MQATEAPSALPTVRIFSAQGMDITSSAERDFPSQLEQIGIRLESLGYSLADVKARSRRVYRSSRTEKPCLPDEECAPVGFTFATLPVRPFSSGHMWFNQQVTQMEGHELPENQPVNVHFTFQVGQ